MLDVISPVVRRSVLGVNLMAQAGNLLGLDHRDNLQTSLRARSSAEKRRKFNSCFCPA